MKKFFSCVTCVAVALTLVACGTDSKDEAAPAAAPVWTNTTVQALVAAKCATSGCHVTGKQAPNFTNVAEATFKANTTAKTRVTAKTMPAAPLSAADYKSFTDFFQQ